MGATYGVHVQGVHTQVKGRQVHALKHLHECLSLSSFHVNNLLRILLHGPFDKAQEVFLVHAGRGVDMCVNLFRQTVYKIIYLSLVLDYSN